MFTENNQEYLRDIRVLSEKAEYGKENQGHQSVQELI